MAAASHDAAGSPSGSASGAPVSGVTAETGSVEEARSRPLGPRGETRPGLPEGRRGTFASFTSRVPWGYWAAAVTASTFGPYIGGGVRIEQAVVYGSLLLIALVAVRSLIKRSVGLGVVLALWLVPTVVATAGAVLSPSVPESYTPGSALAGVDNYVLPIAVMGLVAYWRPRRHARGLLDHIAVTAVVLASANAVIAILQFAGVWKGGTVLSAFWAQDSDLVATLAMGSGRYTGIFGQPLEAGLVYTLSLVLLAYLWMSRERRSPALLALYLVPVVLLVTGSYLTVSKTAMVLGFPLLGALLLIRSRRSRPARQWLLVFASVVVLVGVVLVFGVGDDWYGAQLIKSWGHSVMPWAFSAADSPGLVETISGTRYGENGIVVEFARTMLSSGSWFGYGAAGLNIPYDSAWLELLATSGLVGLSAYVALLAYFTVEWVRRRRRMAPELWVVLGGAVGMAIVGSAGFPALTVNRGSTLLWLLLLIPLLASAQSRGPAKDAEGAGAAPSA